MNVLVTGGAGYIGSHAVKTLGEAGHNVVVLDNFVRGHHQAVPKGVPLEELDLRQTEALANALTYHKIDCVMHFAALAYVGESMQQPARYFRNNAAGTLNLLDAMAEAGIASLVLSSTCAVYGIPERVPVSEEASTKPISPYGESKLQTEKMLPWFANMHGLNWLALRYFNAAGADPDGEIGENHEPETHLVPLGIQAAIGSAPPLRIFGTDYPTPDGTAVRDYIHVSDLADAHVCALDHVLSGRGSGVLNLGTGKGFSVRQIVEETKRISKRPVPVIESDRRAGDPAMLMADSSRASSTLGWWPRHSDLTNIVGTALDWERKKNWAVAAE